MIHRHPWFLALLLVALSGPTASIAAEDVPVHQCDRLAADPVDYERVAPPVNDLRFLPRQSVVACRKAVAANPDEPRFRFQLGRALLTLGNLDEAREVLQSAADDDYAVASLYLGRMFESGSYGERDVAKANEYYRAAGEQGNQDAQLGLALMYRNGVGVEADPAQAFQWAQRAANQGNVRAHALLGLMYYRAEHGVLDLALAAKHFEIAAEAGVPSGQFALGLMYMSGIPMEKDPAKGLKLMESAAEQGFVVAAWELGDKYMRGEDLPLDRERAIYWYCTTGRRGEKLFAEIHGESLDCEGRL